ncbi:Uncharacterised protein [uncultured archaeon]|nr:Uncharacterised protein [uncultured archaeon]
MAGLCWLLVFTPFSATLLFPTCPKGCGLVFGPVGGVAVSAIKMPDYSLIGNYPFVSSARELFKAKPVALDDLILRRASARVTDLFRSRTGPDGTVRPDFQGVRPVEYGAGEMNAVVEEVAVFAAMKLLLAALDRFSVTSKVASKYAAFVGARMDEDEDEPRKRLVAKDFFPSLLPFESDYSVSVTDFLLQAPSDLALQPVANGRVRLSPSQLRHLVVDAVRHKVKDVPRGASVTAGAGFPANVVKIAKEMYDTLPKEQVEFKKFAGKQLAQECCQKILQGMGEGKRFYGAMALSIACVNDELTMEEGEEVLRQYAAACQKGAHDYTEREAINVVQWAMKKGNVRFNCQRLRDQGLIEKFCSNCPHVPFSQRGK